MRTYDLTEPFITPPECQGQAVEYSYALAAEDSAIIERRYDGGDGTTTYTAYDYPRSDDGTWEPQNGRPSLGKKRGTCSIKVEPLQEMP